MTGLESRSLGGVEYRTLLSAVGLTVSSEYEDEGQNHYFDASKAGTATRRLTSRSAAERQGVIPVNADVVALLLTAERQR